MLKLGKWVIPIKEKRFKSKRGHWIDNAEIINIENVFKVTNKKWEMHVKTEMRGSGSRLQHKRILNSPPPMNGLNRQPKGEWGEPKNYLKTSWVTSMHQEKKEKLEHNLAGATNHS